MDTRVGTVGRVRTMKPYHQGAVDPSGRSFAVITVPVLDVIV
jgi:hypothetical protein